MELLSLKPPMPVNVHCSDHLPAWIYALCKWKVYPGRKIRHPFIIEQSLIGNGCLIDQD